ncbi:hypothetical protein TCAL_05725, partial [Tigriopus californicus]
YVVKSRNKPSHLSAVEKKEKGENFSEFEVPSRNESDDSRSSRYRKKRTRRQLRSTLPAGYSTSRSTSFVQRRHQTKIHLSPKRAERSSSISDLSQSSSSDTSRKTSMESNPSSDKQEDLPGLFVTSMTLNERPRSLRSRRRSPSNGNRNQETIESTSTIIPARSNNSRPITPKINVSRNAEDDFDADKESESRKESWITQATKLDDKFVLREPTDDNVSGIPTLQVRVTSASRDHDD